MDSADVFPDDVIGLIIANFDRSEWPALSWVSTRWRRMAKRVFEASLKTLPPGIHRSLKYWGNWAVLHDSPPDIDDVMYAALYSSCFRAVIERWISACGPVIPSEVDRLADVDGVYGETFDQFSIKPILRNAYLIGKMIEKYIPPSKIMQAASVLVPLYGINIFGGIMGSISTHDTRSRIEMELCYLRPDLTWLSRKHPTEIILALSDVILDNYFYSCRHEWWILMAKVRGDLLYLMFLLIIANNYRNEIRRFLRDTPGEIVAAAKANPIVAAEWPRAMMKTTSDIGWASLHNAGLEL